MEVDRLPADMTPQKALLYEYAAGWMDGAEDTLRLLLGEPAHGAVAYAGHRPEELVVWANQALAKLEAASGG